MRSVAALLLISLFALAGCKKDPVLQDIEAFDAIGPVMFLDMKSGETLANMKAAESDRERLALLDEQIADMEKKTAALSGAKPQTADVKVLADMISHGLATGTSGAKAARAALIAKDRGAYDIAILQMLEGQTEVVRGGYAFMALARKKGHIPTP